MIDRNILRKLLDVDDFPTLPEVMNKILEIVDNNSSSAKDLSRVLENDHTISTRILRMSNSAFYALRTRVDTIRGAIVILGFETVRQLALATSVFDSLMRRKQLALDPDDFWMHSLGAAKAAQILGRMKKVPAPDACFTAGLVHDIGKFVMALALKEEYREIADLAREKEAALKDIERMQLQTTHAEVGAWLLERWRFSKMLVDSTDSLYRTSFYTGPYMNEVRITALASDFSRLAGAGDAGDYNSNLLDTRLLESLALTEDQVQTITEELVSAGEEMRQFYSLMSAA